MEDKLFKFGLAAYAVFMVMVLALAVFVLILKTPSPQQITTEESTTARKYVIINLEGNQGSQNGTDETFTTKIFREHNGRIGIFEEDGTLVEILDVYVKTLPETDRRMA